MYATTPVISLGRTLLQDLYSSTPLAASIVPASELSETGYSLALPSSSEGLNILLQPPTLDEITNYFSLIHPLKYSQPHQPLSSPFSPPLNGLTITAYNAGHTVGGTIWHIQHGLESIVYAVDWNQARENVISGAAWLGGAGAGGAEVIEQLRRPTALVCSSKGAERVAAAGGRKKRDDNLLKLIRDAVRGGGRVLIPCDSGARVLELAYLLEDAWSSAAGERETDPSLRSAGLYLASATCGATMRYARSMLEWMEETVVKDFEAAGGSSHNQADNRPRNQRGGGQGGRKDDSKQPRAPFDFRHLRLLERKSQVNRALSASGPAVFLASDTSLDWGHSRSILRSLADDGRNIVILPDPVLLRGSRKGGLSRSLCDLWERRSSGTNVDSTEAVEAGDSVTAFVVTDVAPLVGNELLLYQQYIARQQQLHNVLQPDGASALETSADVVDDRSSSSSSSEESDIDRQGKALNVSAALAHSRHKLGLSDAELGVNILIRQKRVHDYDVRGKKGREKMFPFVVKRKRGDEFGDLIRPEEYLRAEERDDIEGEDLRNGGHRKESALGQKRKWDGVVNKPGTASRRPSNGVNKRRRLGEQSNGVGTASGRGATDDDFGPGGMESSDESDEEEAESAAFEGPRKALFSTQTICLSLRIAVVDFSGLHDKRNLQMLIPLIRPRKLILVGGEKAETLSLAVDCRTLLKQSGGESAEGAVEVFTPVVGDVVDASVDTNAWILRLSHSLFRKLRWHNVRGLGVVALTGRLEAGSDDLPVEEDTRKRLKTARNETEERSTQKAASDVNSHGSSLPPPVLDVVPSSMAAATRSVAQPLHVGDLRLADLRKIMQTSGHTVEFRGEGTLLIDGIVAVRKSRTGRIEVEAGGQSFPGARQYEGTFHAVRRKIYEGLALVAGG